MGTEESPHWLIRYSITAKNEPNSLAIREHDNWEEERIYSKEYMVKNDREVYIVIEE